METLKRSILKAILWNALGLVVMSGVGVVVTGSLAAGGTMAAINTAIGTTMYFLYERLWSGIGWGRHG